MEGEDLFRGGMLQGRARAGPDLRVHLSEREGADLHEKIRQAYWWIANNAILCPYYDIEYGPGTTLSFDECALRQKRLALASTCLLAERLERAARRDG